VVKVTRAAATLEKQALAVSKRSRSFHRDSCSAMGGVHALPVIRQYLDPPDIDRRGLTADGVAAPFDVMTAACQSGPRTALIGSNPGSSRGMPCLRRLSRLNGVGKQEL